MKNTENVLDVNGPGAKDSATVMSYSRLSLESEAQNGQLLGNLSAIRHPNGRGLVTFCSSTNGFGQPIYANTRPNQVPVMPIKPIMNNRNHSSNNFGSSSHLQQIIGENTTPRFMTKHSSTLEV